MRMITHLEDLHYCAQLVLVRNDGLFQDFYCLLGVLADNPLTNACASSVSLHLWRALYSSLHATYVKLNLKYLSFRGH